VAAGPKHAPALVLLHGYMATSTMWSPNIADFSKDYRVYAIDTMGQPSKSIPGEPIRNAAEYVAWLAATLDALHLNLFALVGMSFGGWLALRYTVAAPEHVQKLALLSPGGFLPIGGRLRAMLMMFFPTHFTVNAFMRWLGFTDRSGGHDARPVLNLMYHGMKHFRMPPDTMRIPADPLADGELRATHVPGLLLMSDREPMDGPRTALARARRLLPHVDGELVPHCRHDMCFSQDRIVDARVHDFLNHNRGNVSDRVVA